MKKCVQLAIALISAATLCSAQVPAGIKIRDLRISGDTQIAATKALEGCASELRSRTYDGPDWVDVVANRYRFCLQDEGYFKAVVEAEPKQLPDKDGWHQFDLTLKIQTGSKYLLGDMIFKNVRILNLSELRPLFQIKPGDVFNAGLIRAGMEQLRRTYAERGYRNFTVVPDTKIDETRHIIDVVFDCNEGTRQPT
jgi:outer membrane translocation and assembly module TamA